MHVQVLAVYTVHTGTRITTYYVCTMYKVSVQ